MIILMEQTYLLLTPEQQKYVVENCIFKQTEEIRYLILINL